jgi:RimJ/RimL family protein N-acetyltransferase
MLSIRKVEEKDIQLLFEWANDPMVRKNSLNSNKISWEEHVKWFRSKLNDGNSYFYMVVNAQGELTAFVRFEKKDRWFAGIVVAPESQGRGIGKDALGRSIDEFFKCVREPIYAQIKRSNVASIKVFEYNDFSKVDDGDVLLYRRDFQ